MDMETVAAIPKYNLTEDQEKRLILREYRALLRSLKPKLKLGDKELIRSAFEMAAEAHKTMRRKSGEPYILHPLAVARICSEEIGLGVRSTICALLHDTVEDTDITLEDIEREFSSEIARIVDGSDFDEFKPMYGSPLVTGWARLHGYPLGILANARGVLFSEESQKATQFIQLANQVDVPLLFLQNTTGFMVGKEYEQAGIIKHGAMMINAVSNSSVPHLTVNIGASYGAGNYGMCGRAYDPRFLFAWPNARSAVMGPAQLAGVLSIVGRQSAAARGLAFDADADDQRRQQIEAQIEQESHAFFVSARLYDDGVIDPRDTRSVLGMALSAAHSGPVQGRRGFGVFRM